MSDRSGNTEKSEFRKVTREDQSKLRVEVHGKHQEFSVRIHSGISPKIKEAHMKLTSKK